MIEKVENPNAPRPSRKNCFNCRFLNLTESPSHQPNTKWCENPAVLAAERRRWASLVTGVEISLAWQTTCDRGALWQGKNMALQPHGRWYPDVADLLNEYFSMEEPLFDFYGEGRRGDYYLYQVDYYGVPVAQILEIDDRTCLFHVGGEYRWISYNFGGNFSDFAVAFVNLVGDLWDKMQEMEKNQNDD